MKMNIKMARTNFKQTVTQTQHQETDHGAYKYAVQLQAIEKNRGVVEEVFLLMENKQ